MIVPGLPVWRSITGRLYCVIAAMFISILTANVQTITYADAVAGSTHALELRSIESMRAVDAFDATLDDHRRALKVAAGLANPAGIPSVIARLSGIEHEFAENPALSGAESAPSAELVARLKADAADLRTLSREAIQTASAPSGANELPYAVNAYSLRADRVEDDVATWKMQARQTIASELAKLSTGAEITRDRAFILTMCGCLVGLLSVCVSRSVLSRLHRLTSSMLVLASGDLAAEVPFRGANDEIGRLADALGVFRDNAERVIASEANMSAVIENMVESIVMFSPDHTVLLYNQKFVGSMGTPSRDCKGMTGVEVIQSLVIDRGWPAELAQSLHERLIAMHTRTDAETFDVNLPDGRSLTITAAVLPNRNLLLSVEDITERRASAARIFHLAHHDVLTDLPNRALFQERLAAAVDDALIEHGLGVTLLLCDLDRFKAVNDTYGHLAGDELLRQVAERMCSSMRRTDILARLGGDEFAIIHLSGAAEAKEAHVLAERIVTALQLPFEIFGNQVCIGVSIGIALAPQDATCPVQLMKHADLALYAAKHGGRNMFVVYDESMAAKLAERRGIETDLRKALEAEAFTVHYQPQVDLRTRRITGFEALCRWTHPERGPIAPGVFIPIAEESGLIIELGEWVLRKACADAVTWGGDTTIAVNVSAQQFREESFVSLVRSILQNSMLPAVRLELEVTETAMLNDGEKMLAMLHALRDMGVQLSVDDFGTGYSALHYLQKFPFNKIKIDQSFIRNLGSTEESDAIVRAVAGLGANLGLITVAEGIETEEQAKIVFGADCIEGQGFLFGRPVPLSEIRDLLASQKAAAVV